MTAIVIGVSGQQVSGTLVTTKGPSLLNEYRKGDVANPIATFSVGVVPNQIFFMIFDWTVSDPPPITSLSPYVTIQDSLSNDLVKIGASSQLVAFLLPKVETIPGNVDIIVDPVTVGETELTIYSSIGGIS